MPKQHKEQFHLSTTPSTMQKQYKGPYHSALSVHLTASLSTLTHQATNYKPGKVHHENFNRLKMEISNMKALPYFHVNAETTLQMDA